jgi:membrane protein implicated in regulation of membrane protease activity
MNTTELWLIAALIAGIVEILVPLFGFVFVSMAAVVGALAAAAGLSPTLQVLFFTGSLILFLLVLRPIAKRTGSRGVPSRTEAIVGRRAQVVQAIDPVLGTGRVTVGGDDWAARCAIAIPAGAEVIVAGADGIVLIVAPAPSASV